MNQTQALAKLMSAQHTPGPWEVKAQGDANAYCILAGSRWLISFLQNGEPWTDEQLANARLIAAAPKMLAALLLAQRLCLEALPKFDWGASALDANAIALLNTAPRVISDAIAASTESTP